MVVGSSIVDTEKVTLGRGYPATARRSAPGTAGVPWPDGETSGASGLEFELAFEDSFEVVNIFEIIY
jgi:hypothetical protein